MAVPLLPAPLRHLLEDFSRLPGIGPKSAQRIVFALLNRRKEELEKFAEDLRAIREAKSCATCGMLSEADHCAICRDPGRDQTTLCVVETPIDVLALERAGPYRGVYHVLGGVISPLEHVGPGHLTIASLLRRVNETKPAEIILALNPSTEGETTVLYLQERLRNFRGRVSRLAQGLPTGAALEFADDLTIARALAGRREVRERVTQSGGVVG